MAQSIRTAAFTGCFSFVLCLVATLPAAAMVLRIDRCSALVDGIYKPTLTATFGSESYEFKIGADGLTAGTALTRQKAVAWVKAKIGQPRAVAYYTVCDHEDPRIDFDRNDN